jgi:hypothetical protein
MRSMGRQVHIPATTAASFATERNRR